jgi:uncharacterized protein YndB with AHSA1/START domain
MNILIKILVGIGVLIGVVLIVAAFMKKEYTIEREITINKPKAEVFNYVKHLKNQDHYSKWVMTDPAMKKDFKGQDGTPGFVYAWDSKMKNAGKGEQEIKGISEGERVDIEIRFERPMQSIATTPIVTEAISENETRVRWSMNGKNNYPLNIMNLFIDGMLGKDMETSLTTLKGILEK